MKCKICNPTYSENLRLKGEASTFSNFQFIPRLLLLATLNWKCGQEITWMKRKKDGKQAIDNSCWNSKKHSLKRKNKYRVSQNLQPNQKCLKTAMWWTDSTPCFSGTEGILSSHSIRSGILAEDTAIDFWRGVKQLLNFLTKYIRKSFNANICKFLERKKISLPKACKLYARTKS